ncbi:unnamed protein product [Larinioides sclopetarius]|uniref:Uncharacterized protein n=1 Tax=Larinioides sclopetarius TaxID=280406 RepID=A0AAV1ZDJ1_9ARAC
MTDVTEQGKHIKFYKIDQYLNISMNVQVKSYA